MPVTFMADGTRGVNMLLFGLSLFFGPPDWAPHKLSVNHFLEIFATLATIQALSLVGLFAKNRFHFLLTATAVFGSICAVYIFFAYGGSTQDLVVVCWLLGLTFSVIGQLILTFNLD